jgi:hypothetical protein
MEKYDDRGGPISQHDFIEALEKGDTKRAAHVARQLSSLDGEAIEVLADALDDDPGVRHFLPFRLVPARRQRGRPANAVARLVRDTMLARWVNQLLEKYNNYEAACHASYERIGLRPDRGDPRVQPFPQEEGEVPKRLAERTAFAGVREKPEFRGCVFAWPAGNREYLRPLRPDQNSP